MRATDVDMDQARKAQLLDAAKQRFSRFGFKKTTVDEIAEAAGMSKRTVYEVFNSKEEILAELVMREALAFRKELMGELKLLSDPVEKLRLFCDRCSQYFDRNPFLGQVLFDRAGLYAPFLGDEIVEIEGGMRDIISNLLREGMRKGDYRDLALAETTECVFVLFRGFTYQRTEPQNGNKEWVRFILRAIEKET